MKKFRLLTVLSVLSAILVSKNTLAYYNSDNMPRIPFTEYVINDYGILRFVVAPTGLSSAELAEYVKNNNNKKHTLLAPANLPEKDLEKYSIKNTHIHNNIVRKNNISDAELARYTIDNDNIFHLMAKKPTLPTINLTHPTINTIKETPNYDLLLRSNHKMHEQYNSILINQPKIDDLVNPYIVTNDKLLDKITVNLDDFLHLKTPYTLHTNYYNDNDNSNDDNNSNNHTFKYIKTGTTTPISWTLIGNTIPTTNRINIDSQLSEIQTGGFGTDSQSIDWYYIRDIKPNTTPIPVNPPQNVQVYLYGAYGHKSGIHLPPTSWATIGHNAIPITGTNPPVDWYYIQDIKPTIPASFLTGSILTGTPTTGGVPVSTGGNYMGVVSTGRGDLAGGLPNSYHNAWLHIPYLHIDPSKIIEVQVQIALEELYQAESAQAKLSPRVTMTLASYSTVKLQHVPATIGSLTPAQLSAQANLITARTNYQEALKLLALAKQYEKIKQSFGSTTLYLNEGVGSDICVGELEQPIADLEKQIQIAKQGLATATTTTAKTSQRLKISNLQTKLDALNDEKLRYLEDEAYAIALELDDTAEYAKNNHMTNPSPAPPPEDFDDYIGGNPYQSVAMPVYIVDHGHMKHKKMARLQASKKGKLKAGSHSYTDMGNYSQDHMVSISHKSVSVIKHKRSKQGRMVVGHSHSDSNKKHNHHRSLSSHHHHTHSHHTHSHNKSKSKHNNSHHHNHNHNHAHHQHTQHSYANHKSKR